MQRRNFLSVIFLIVITLSSCQSDKNNKHWKPTPPIPGLEIQPTEYIINPNADTTLVHKSGTSLIIPANCFKRVDDQPIEGDITISYREFHDGIDIMLAGIHMDFYSMGEKYTFNTAGMFDINANADGKEVIFNENKQIDIRFASKYQGDNYSFFYLNSESGAWEWVNLPEPAEVNQEKIDAQKVLNSKIQPNYLSEEYFVLNLKILLDIYFNNDWRKIHENKYNKTVLEHLKTYNFTIYDTDIYDEVKFLNGFYQANELLWKDLDKKDIPEWINNVNIEWEKTNNKWIRKNYNLNKISNNTYEFVVSDGKKRFTKRMEAVMPLKNILKYKPEEWHKRYDEALKEVEEEQRRINLMAETYRTFAVNKLGIFNFDYLMNETNWFKVNSTFTSNNQTVENSIFVIFGDNSGYVKVDPYNSVYNLKINPESKHRIIMILPEQEILYYPVEEYEKWDIRKLREAVNPDVHFEMKSQKISSPQDLRDFLKF